MILRTISASINRSVGEGRNSTSLSFKAVLDNTRDRLELATGEIARSPNSYIYSDLKEPNPTLSVSICQESFGRAPVDEGADRVGGVLYSKASDLYDHHYPSNIDFRLYVTDDDFEQLVASASAGVLPTTFVIHNIEGIQQSGPEGNDMTWDNEARPILPITKAAWNYEITTPPSPEGKPPAAPQPAPATPHVMSMASWGYVAIIVALAVWVFNK
jgi:hypothetical protein